MRLLGALALAAIVLAGCGTVSATQAARNWMSQSGFNANRATLIGDVESSESALRAHASSTAALHTVCEVLDTDALAANASLPAPDTQATNLLAQAYSSLGSGAGTCYSAGSSTPRRAEAIRFMQTGLAQLSFATMRLDVAANRSSS